jgi:hypothetical protein
MGGVCSYPERSIEMQVAPSLRMKKRVGGYSRKVADGGEMRSTSILEFVSKERLQYLVMTALSIGAVGLTGIIDYSNPLLFQRFIGSIDPFAAAFLMTLLGWILLSFLLSRGWFAIYKKENLKGLVCSSGLAALLGLIMILVDLKVVFPEDLNILFPESLLFYPAIGFFAEILFHVLPLSVLLMVLTSIFRTVSDQHMIWICIFAVALLEPIYQTITGFSNPYPLSVLAYVGLHVFLINLFQLLIFKRYDFISMYAFRLVYYLFWHIGWGYARLKLLF